ncbi:MAG: thiolase family protein [Alphaproteobacteria bacterium]|nr:thiolase family protein [Alphaproteobacteria bacterium]
MTSSFTPVVVTGYTRTPMGAFQGQFQKLSATDLAGQAIKGLLEPHQNKNLPIDHVILGCVVQAGLGQAPARQAILKAGLSNSVPGFVVNKVCGSAMQAIMLASQHIMSHTANVMIAGGMESMSNSPYLLTKARSGLRMGHGEVLDSLFLDGLEDACENLNPMDAKGGRSLMGVYAEKTAEKYGFSRQDQETYATQTYLRYHEHQGHIAREITPVTVDQGKGNVITVETDEPPHKVHPEKFANLRGAFQKDGTVTAATSSSLADGAAALLLMSQTYAQENHFPIYAKILGMATHAQAPQWFTTAPVGAIQKLLDQLKWGIDDVDLFEINEAFAVVTMAAIHDLKIDPDKVNVFGGACTLGHPIGCSGARIVVTLINALNARGLKRGIAAICIGGGEALALAVELP